MIIFQPVCISVFVASRVVAIFMVLPAGLHRSHLGGCLGFFGGGMTCTVWLKLTVFLVR